jgi:hypothetical protein
MAREDEYVDAIGRQWSTDITWIDSESVPLLTDLGRRASERDDPYAHLFEPINRTLAETSASLGARVAFDGYGGDQLFHVSEVYLADLFGRLHWRQLRSSLAAFDIRGVRGIVRHCLIPWLPGQLWQAIQRARGRSANDGLEQTLPPWLASPWGEDARVRRRARLEPPRRFFESPAAYESRWYTRTPYFPRAVSWAGAIALGAGVDVRSPLLDRRVMRFAASRPLAERVAPGESKVLLREAVKGLIPASVLASRKTKTGIPRGYLHRRLGAELATAAGRVFGRRSLLSDLGIVDATRYLRGIADYSQSAEHMLGVQLLLTLQCELWLRSVAGETD